MKINFKDIRQFMFLLIINIITFVFFNKLLGVISIVSLFLSNNALSDKYKNKSPEEKKNDLLANFDVLYKISIGFMILNISITIIRAVLIGFISIF